MFLSIYSILTVMRADTAFRLENLFIYLNNCGSAAGYAHSLFTAFINLFVKL